MLAIKYNLNLKKVGLILVIHISASVALYFKMVPLGTIFVNLQAKCYLKYCSVICQNY